MASGTIQLSANLSGTDANGNHYLKLPDGTLMCWGTSTQKYTSTNAWGGGYVANFTQAITFPVAFYATPFVTVTNNFYSQSAYSGVCSRIECSSTGIAQIQLMRLTAFSATVDHELGWLAVGRWKA